MQNSIQAFVFCFLLATSTQSFACNHELKDLGLVIAFRGDDRATDLSLSQLTQPQTAVPYFGYFTIKTDETSKVTTYLPLDSELGGLQVTVDLSVTHDLLPNLGLMIVAHQIEPSAMVELYWTFGNRSIQKEYCHISQVHDDA